LTDSQPQKIASSRGSIIYEVNLTIEPAIAEAYQKWLIGHIPQVLRCEGFESAEMFCRKAADEGSKETAILLTVCYRIRDRPCMERYIAEYAPRMRGEAISLFGTQFKASRRILERHSVFVPTNTPSSSHPDVTPSTTSHNSSTGSLSTSTKTA